MYRTNYTHITNSTFARCEQYVRASFTYAYASPAHFYTKKKKKTCWTEKNKKNLKEKNKKK